MDKNALKYFKVVGKVQQAISKVSSFDDALKEGLKVILDNSAADYGVMWYIDKSKGEVLHPYYWICPNDFSAKEYPIGQGMVGKSYATKEPVIIYDLNETPDENIASDFTGLNPVSAICIPFSNDFMELGCIQFVKTDKSGVFTEEEADLCQLLCLMTELAINETAPLPDNWNKKPVIMSVRNVIKDFKNGDNITHVLKGVNFDVFEGEFLALLGESGCGKSTVLNIIGGMDTATDGTVVFSENDLSNASEAQLTKYRRDNIGFVFQSYNLMPNLNVKQNLDLIAELVDNPMDSVEALKLVKMEDKMTSYPLQLSGGQQQRVSIARALVKNPKLILADEPTAALDYATSIEVLQAFKDVIDSGTTLIMVTHNEEITKMANRVIRFRNGQMYEVTINRHPVEPTELVW